MKTYDCLDFFCLGICIFAEDKLHSAIREQALIALVCVIFAEDKLRPAIRQGILIMSVRIVLTLG